MCVAVFRFIELPTIVGSIKIEFSSFIPLSSLYEHLEMCHLRPMVSRSLQSSWLHALINSLTLLQCDDFSSQHDFRINRTPVIVNIGIAYELLYTAPCLHYKMQNEPSTIMFRDLCEDAIQHSINKYFLLALIGTWTISKRSDDVWQFNNKLKTHTVFVHMLYLMISIFQCEMRCMRLCETKSLIFAIYFVFFFFSFLPFSFFVHSFICVCVSVWMM